FWLSADRDEAGKKYEEIRGKLIRLFTCRGCPHPEELADETINRVIKAMENKVSEYSGDPILFFFGVAKNVFLESTRVKVLSPKDIIVFEPATREHDFQCLETCMAGLSEQSRNLIRRYYQHDGQAKIKL